MPTWRSPADKSGPRFMHDQEFEDEASLVLAEYSQSRTPVSEPPIPIDDIVQEHFKLVVEYRDLRAEYPEGDVLGAIWFEEKRIAVDVTLVPEDFPAMRGRYHFTLAHELGHWRLHRHLYLGRRDRRPLLPSGDPAPDHILRSSQSDPKEVQANRFAACLLMPREMVKREWHEWHGDMEPIYLEDLRTRQDEILAKEAIRRGGFKPGDDATDNVLMEHASRPLAERFQVSAVSMQIRLQQLKLMRPKREPSLFS